MKRIYKAIVVFSLAAFLLLTTVSIAPAQPAGPFYVGAFGGFVAPADMDVEVLGYTEEADLDTSWTVGAKVGYIFPQVNWLAAELEYFYLGEQSFDQTLGFDATYGRISSDGDYQAHNLMANLVLRYPEGKIHPYFGFGFGWSRASIEINGEASSLGRANILDEEENAFASQVFAGVNFEITPRWSVDLAYKYFYSKYEMDFSGVDVDAEAQDHIVTAGVNFHF